MNIAMFSDTYVPQKNGVATAVKMYKDEMEKLGHNVFVFVPEYENSYKREERNVFEFPALSYFKEKEQRFALPFSKQLFKIKNLNLDIIHSHAPFSMGIMARILSSNLGLKHVGTHHTMYEYYRHYAPLIIRPSFNQSKKLIKHWCMKLDKVIAPTDNIKNVLIDYGVPYEHIVVIPTGIDMYSFDKPIKWDLRKEYNINEEDKILLFVGRLAKEKNIDFLIKNVFKKIVEEEKNVKFVIVGDGNERENLEEIVINEELQQKVIFTGGQAREKVIDAYKQANLFIFASYTETQGLVVLESLASGTPVVALGKMGVYDLLSRKNTGGIMIPELNADDFINNILRLLNNEEEYNKLSSKGKVFVKNNFSLTTNVEKLIEVYKNLI
jgi:glycosyltransferase involved in cell wall biosynthesis